MTALLAEHLLSARGTENTKVSKIVPVFTGLTGYGLLGIIKISHSKITTGMRYKGQVHSAVNMLDCEALLVREARKGFPGRGMSGPEREG